MKLNELKKEELKRELEKWDEDSSWNKRCITSTIVLEEAVEQPEIFLFTVASDMDDILNLIIEASRELRRENLEHSRELKQYILECSRNMEQSVTYPILLLQDT